MLIPKNELKAMKKVGESQETLIQSVLMDLNPIEKEYIIQREFTRDSAETIWYYIKENYKVELNLDEIENWYKKVYKQYLKIRKKDSQIIL